jgi:hypothetical protein
MTTDAEVEAATEAMRKIRTVGGKIHDDVLRAYARAALEAAERVLIERVRKRTESRQNLSNGNPPPGWGKPAERPPVLRARWPIAADREVSGPPHQNKGWGAGDVWHGDAANYVLALPPERVEYCNRWRHAARLLLDQADVADVSRQVHLALFYYAQLDIGAMDWWRDSTLNAPGPIDIHSLEGMHCAVRHAPSYRHHNKWGRFPSVPEDTRTA